MPKFLVSFAAVFSLLISPLGFGWNTYGHLVVSDLALSKLEPAKQRYFEQLAYTLVRQMDSQKRLYLMRTFEDTSAVAQLSVFPDDWRDIPVAKLFEDYAGELPVSMLQYADTATNTWHYINQPYQREGVTSSCSVDAQPNAVSVLPDLISAYKESSEEGVRALSLAFILHLVADLHNPLHTVTKFDTDCESDLGGNRFCVAYHRGGRSCEENLHQAWDRGLGFFEEYEKIADAEQFLSRVRVDTAAAEVLDPQVWAAEGLSMARLVYSASEGETLDPYYISEGKIISYEQLALGAARLAAILDEL